MKANQPSSNISKYVQDSTEDKANEEQQQNKVAIKKSNKQMIDTQKIMEYIQKPLNQKAKLPPYLDGTQIYSNQIESLNKRMKALDSLTALISVVTIVLIYLENDLFWQAGNISNSTCSGLRALIVVLSAIIIICIIIHYNYVLSVIKFRDNLIDENVTLTSTGLWKALICEILIQAFVCPPSVDITYSMVQLGEEIKYSFDAMTAVVSLFRLYTVIRLFEHYSHWTNERSKRVCKMNGAQANAFFALKAYLKLKPYVILTVGLVVSTFVLGFALRTFEIGLQDLNNNFNYVWNSFWVVILTMTTIGYGDIYPKTHLGRITCIIACIWGVFILSLFVVALTNTTEFTQKEEQVYEAIIMERAVRRQLKKDAGQLIKEFILLTYLRRKQLESKRRTRLVMGIIAKSGRFKIKRLNVSAKEEDNDELLSQMQNQIDDSLKELKNGLDSMRVLFENAKKTQEEQREFEMHVRKSHKLSVCLVNLASLLTEFGPIRPIKSMNEIESKNVLSAEELKEKIFKGMASHNTSYNVSKTREIGQQEEVEDEYDDNDSSPAYSEFSPISPDRRR